MQVRICFLGELYPLFFSFFFRKKILREHNKDEKIDDDNYPTATIFFSLSPSFSGVSLIGGLGVIRIIDVVLSIIQPSHLCTNNII